MAAKSSKPKQTSEPKAKAKAKLKDDPKVKAAPKTKTVPKLKPEAKPESMPELAPLTPEVYPAQPMKQAVEQFVETHQENEAGQQVSAHGGIAGQCAEKASGGRLAYPSASAGYREREPDTPSDSTPEPSILPTIRKVLDSHEIMEYLSDCEFRLDASTAKHGDTYRLFVDDYPTDMAIVCKAGRCTIGNKSHPSPADAARAICDALLAKIRAGGKR